MPRPRRLTLADRAGSVPTTAIPRSAGKGSPCEHWSGCRRPWTSWTVRGGRCDHHPLTPAETPVIGPADRQRWVRGGSYANLARSNRRDDPADTPHPFAQARGAGRGICGCGLGIRATIHHADTDEGTAHAEDV